MKLRQIARAFPARLWLLGFLFAAGTAGADTMQREIDHLLAYLSDSGCSYVRNGKAHTAAEAVEHITRKFEYFRDDIESTEQFIELSASKSTMTGRPYLIRCPGDGEQPSRAWLLAELARYRSSEP